MLATAGDVFAKTDNTKEQLKEIVIFLKICISSDNTAAFSVSANSPSALVLNS